MRKFPRKEEGKKEKKRKVGEKKGKKGMVEGERKKERKKERKVKRQNRVGYWERQRKCVKRNESAWLATRKKNTFWALCISLFPVYNIFIC